MRSIRLLAFALVVLLATGRTQASTTFTDQTSNHNWSTPANWSDGVPNIDKDAIIDTDKTCIISTADGAARTLEIKSGATLRIDSKDLTVAAPGYGANFFLDGRLEFKKSGAAVPQLLYRSESSSGGLFVQGAGVIDASAANGLGSGNIKNAAGYSGYVLFYASSVETYVQVKGAVRFDIDGDLWVTVDNFPGAKLIVDNEADVMEIGTVDVTNPTLKGAVHGFAVSEQGNAWAGITVAAGEIRVGRMKFGDRWVGPIIVDGGTFHVTASVPDNTHAPCGSFQVKSGTARFDTQWVNGASQGWHLLFTGGSVQVKSGKKVSFE